MFIAFFCDLFHDTASNSDQGYTNPGRHVAVTITVHTVAPNKITVKQRAGVKNPLGDQKVPEASSCKCLGIILRSDLNWVDQVNYTAQKSWKALHFVMRVLKKGNRNTTSIADTSLILPILERGSACWDPCRDGQINALDRIQKRAAQFTSHTKEI
jgi:hypothetical protein